MAVVVAAAADSAPQPGPAPHGHESAATSAGRSGYGCMRWFWYCFYRLLPAVVVVAITIALAAVMSPWLAWAATTSIGAVAATSGALLANSTRVGEFTWKNRVAALLLPWGYVLGRGRLPTIGLVCVIVWALLSAAVLLARGGTPAAAPTAATASAMPSWPLIASWIVGGCCLFYMLGMMVKYPSPGSSANRAQRKIVVVLLLMLGGSVALHLSGYTGFATLLAGGPPLAIGALYGLFLAVILIFGRNLRWN